MPGSNPVQIIPTHSQFVNYFLWKLFVGQKSRKPVYSRFAFLNPLFVVAFCSYCAITDGIVIDSPTKSVLLASAFEFDSNPPSEINLGIV